MYLLNWNPQQQKIEATFGGVITTPEARVFAEELDELLLEIKGEAFDFSLDYATTSRMDDEVRSIFQTCREQCYFAGANKVTFVTRDENEAHRLTSTRLQQVLEGKEEYVAFGLAA